MALRLEMEQAKSILPRLFQQDQRPLRELDLILAYWSEMVGPLVAEHSRPLRLYPPRLLVEVRGPEWRELLVRMQSQLVSLLRKELPNSSVRRIEFRLAEHDEDLGRRRKP